MNIFIACDGKYYDKWGLNCLRTIQNYNPWIQLTAHIVNPISKNELTKVHYFYEDRSFVNEASEISYYQSVRFIKCSEYFPNNELVMTIDCDTVCTRSFSIAEFTHVCQTTHVQRHQKADKWMAGLVTYGNTSAFRNDLKTNLLKDPIELWKYGRDQDVLNSMAYNYNFKGLNVGEWMSFGKGRGIFITLKGTQKTKDKFLKNYKEVMKKNEAT